MTDDNVIKFSGVTYADIPPDDVLNGAIGRLFGVVVLGYTTDGDEYFASSYSDSAQTLWLLERLKHKLLGEHDDE